MIQLKFDRRKYPFTCSDNASTVNLHIQYSYLIIALTCVETILFISFCFDFQDILRISTHKEHTPHDQHELQQNMDSIVARSMNAGVS